jgi:prevent-host-death family protein
MEWQLQTAKMKFSELVRRAVAEGPQIVTVHGKRNVVVLSNDEYMALVAKKPSFTKFLISGDRWPNEVVEAINDRPGDLPREVEF